VAVTAAKALWKDKRLKNDEKKRVYIVRRRSRRQISSNAGRLGRRRDPDENLKNANKQTYQGASMQ